jgi:class 3 adenylate cyclase/tetratricopeptide (TPR) repeat protein
MKLLDILREVRRHLAENGRVSLRMLRRQYELDDDALDELIEELVDVQRVARREENILVWAAEPKPAAVARAPVIARHTEQADARKIVTILFADLAGSTALHERLDPESVRHFMEGYYAAMRAAVDAHGGTVVKLLGDGVMAAFGVPTVAEDDALRAVRAGMGMQQAFHRIAGEQSARVGDIGLRVAINTGEVVVNADNTDVVGDPVNVAARLQQEARNGDVVLGESTHRLVGTLLTLTPLGSVALKGRAEAVKAFRVESLERPTGAGAAAFVGRDAELARLTAVYDAAVAEPATRLAVLLGSPGLGKSRLIGELARRVGDTTTVLSAHCDAAGGATFAPLAAALRTWLAAGQTEGADPVSALEAVIPASPERTRIAGGIAALLAGSPASPEETFFVVRRFMAALAQAKPVVLVIDDLHWGEPLLLDLVEHLVQWGGGVPLLVLVGARPELRDVRSSLVTRGALVADVLTLAGLDAGAAMRLAANVIGAEDLPAAVAAKVLATSEGNPLFVGELVRMLVDEGAIERQGERWIVGTNLAALEMPPTIHALLAARIERLRPEERTVLERASVVGRHFSRSAVAALLSRNGNELDARLESLRRSELIEPDSGWFLGEPVLRFHHVLIRDAAYRRLLKGTRAELHERLADWIEAKLDHVAEHDETIGWHLEQAHQHLRELGPIDAKGRGLGERAAKRLAAAGRRALGRDDLPVAADLLGRAIERLDAGDAARADLALDWCEALLSAGDVGKAAQAIDELGRFIHVPSPAPAGEGQGGARLRAWHSCFASQLTILTAPQGLQAAADAADKAAQQLAAQDDAAGEAKAHSVRAQALARLGKVGACEAALDQALAAARKAGDRRRANAVLAGAPVAALWGPSPVTRASGRCLDVVRVLRITQGAPAVEAVALSCQAVLEALRGRTDAARRMLASARKMVEDLGIAQRLFEVDFFAGRIALLEGDAAGAERLLRGAYHGLRDLGLGIDAARAGALLARALLAEDHANEAEALSHESERLAGDDLQAAIAWRGVRAEALAKRGEHAAAVEFAKAAVTIASATDALLDHADARVALAAALRAAGRGTEADAEERRAIELWETKGATLLAERTRRAETQSEAMPGATAPRVDATDAAQRRVRRRVRTNAATAMQARFDAALAARDFDGIVAVFHEDHQEIDHPTGSSYGREAAVASLRRLFRSHDPHYQAEPLATLGEFLLLVRRRSGAAGTTSARYDVGTYENVAIQLFEVDASGLCRRAEVFAADQLGNAIVRLYERYAELLPDGPARQRAAVTARAIAYSLTDCVASDMSLLFDPSYADVDHRSVGYGTLSTDQAAKLVESQRALADGLRLRVEDVLALRPDGLVRRTTTSGTWRGGGGAFERTVCILSTFAPDGRAARQETFDSDREAEALARFDQITGAQRQASVRRRVQANAATRGIDRFRAVLAARDGVALAEVFGASLNAVHHPTRATYGRREMLSTWRSIMKAERMDFRSETLASLGDALALERHLLSIEGLREDHVAGFGRSEFDELALIEADDRERWVHCEIFAADRLRSAIVRLYERYAESLPEGAARTRARKTVPSLAAFDGPIDPDRLALVYAPSFECIDHRILGTWSAHGPDEWRRHWQGQADLAAGVMLRDDDVLALGPAAIALRQTFFGTGLASGGAFENAIISVVTLGAEGLVTRTEVFEPEREAEALARFDELCQGATSAEPPQPFANAASRLLQRGIRCWAARDWDGLLAELSPALRMDDRRRMMRLEIGYTDFIAQFRMLFDQPASRWHATLLATRGERLSLHRTSFAAEVAEGGGALEADDHLSLTEVDRDGRWIASVTFDLADEDAAYAELDARWEVGEGTAHPAAAAWRRGLVAALNPRDWDAVRALYSPAVTARDHRLVGWGTLRGLNAYLEALRSMFALAPDARMRGNHLRTSSRGLIIDSMWVGTRDGGAFESPFLAVVEIDASGTAQCLDFYDPHHLGDAIARFKLLSTAPPPEPFANAATRAGDRLLAAWEARDWSRVEAVFAAGFRQIDHSKLSRLDLDRDQQVASLRYAAELPGSRFTGQALATRGERSALGRIRNDIEGGDVGPSELTSLVVSEVDERGDFIAFVRYDADDVDAASAELDARYDAGEGAMHAAHGAIMHAFTHAVVSRDWNPVLALCAPEFIEHDHRSLAVLGTTRGAAAWAQNFSTLVDLAPDTVYRSDHFRSAARGFCSVGTWVGSRDGGRYEIPLIAILELDDRDRLARADIYDPDQLDQALARFDALSTGAVPNPLAAVAKGNAATAGLDRWPVFDIGAATDWDELLASCAPDMVFEDRQGFARLSGDREMMIASLRERVANGARAERQLLGTAGERIAITRMLWAGGPADGRFEIEYLSVLEVDTSGLVVAIILFGLDDTRAAQREAWARWAAIDPAAGAVAAPYGEVLDAANGRDLARYRALFADQLVLEDHRHGLRIEGLDTYAERVALLWQQAPDARIDGGWFWPALARHGAVAVTRRLGALADEFLWLFTVEHGRIARIELFSLDAVDAAVARLAELRPDPLRIPPNDATRVLARWEAAVADGDAAPIRAFYDSSYRFEDRRRLFRTTVDVEGAVANDLQISGGGWRSVRTLLATAGDRLTLQHVMWTTGAADAASEIEMLALDEVNPQGRFVWTTLFDPDDRVAASRELFERYAANGADGAPRATFDVVQAWNDHDLERLRTLLPADFYLDDRRRTGVGRLDSAAAYLGSLKALWDLSRDLRIEVLYYDPPAAHGRLYVARWSGTNAEGGDFDAVYVCLGLSRGDRPVGLEIFELDDFEAARARFAELGAATAV